MDISYFDRPLPEGQVLLGLFDTLGAAMTRLENLDDLVTSLRVNVQFILCADLDVEEIVPALHLSSVYAALADIGDQLLMMKENTHGR